MSGCFLFFGGVGDVLFGGGGCNQLVKRWAGWVMLMLVVCPSERILISSMGPQPPPIHHQDKRLNLHKTLKEQGVPLDATLHASTAPTGGGGGGGGGVWEDEDGFAAAAAAGMGNGFGSRSAEAVVIDISDDGEDEQLQRALALSRMEAGIPPALLAGAEEEKRQQGEAAAQQQPPPQEEEGAEAATAAATAAAVAEAEGEERE